MSLQNNIGALPDFRIKELADNNFIRGLRDKNLNPSSYDVCLGDEIYQLHHSFQISRNQTILETMRDVGYEKHSLTDPLLEGRYYVVFIDEQIDLPSNMYSYANPKSTTGRLDLHTRLIADRVRWYDALPKGFSGKVACLVTPKSFPVLLCAGMSLNQLRFFNGDARLESSELEFLMQKEGLFFNPDKQAIHYKDMTHQDDRSLLLTLGTDYAISAYVSKENVADPIDLSLKGHYDWRDYFEEVIKQKDGSLILEKDRFYIGATHEHILVPPLYAGEIASVDDRLGEFRSHYAGFVDNGFGYGKEGELKGLPIVLEIRSFETMKVNHCQPVARVKFEPTIDRPHKIYGEDGLGSNYSEQTGPRLAKQFKR